MGSLVFLWLVCLFLCWLVEANFWLAPTLAIPHLACTKFVTASDSTRPEHIQGVSLVRTFSNA